MHAVARALWHEPRPAAPPARVWRDWALVGALVPAAVLEAAFRPELPWRTLSVIITVGLVPTLLWRRTHPLLMIAIVFGVTGVATLVAGAEVPGLSTQAYVLLLPYALLRWGSGREAVAGAAIMLGHLGLDLARGGLGVADAFAGSAILLTAMAIGVAVRYQARARARALDQAKLLERERLARDLHDIVAHHVSAIAIRAQAGLATSGTHPDAAADALRVIEAEASRTLAEMRGMVRVLRRDEVADLAPNPRATDLLRLAERPRTGPVVDVELSGDLAGLPPPVDAAVYRLAQESVTNALRHARHATRIEVRVEADDTCVRLRVRDDGEARTGWAGVGSSRSGRSGAGDPRTGGTGTGDPRTGRPDGLVGYGLAGMVERAGLLGGTCEAGPDPGRGWTVSAVLPRTGWAA